MKQCCLSSLSMLPLLALLAGSPLSSIAEPLLPTQSGWDSGFIGDNALNHVTVLASDSLRGRYSGFSGADKADRYIMDHFADLKLEPPWGRDGYLHRFNYGAGEYLMPSGLTALFPDGSTDTAHFWQDLNIFKYSGFGKAKAKVVLIGYGIGAEDQGWDDYAGVDVKGAIVLAWRGLPQVEGKDFGNWGYSGRKTSYALERGAVGFVYCETDPPKYATIMEEFYRKSLPAMWVSKTFADTLLKNSGHTKDEWKKLADSTKTPISRTLDVTVEMQVSGQYYPKRETNNLGGLYLGSDPILRNEVVVIGAHMDHHGVDAAGNLYPGADDNASGTATMMELARVFRENNPRLKRSVMFMGFACEEEGLCGSKAFVREPRLPAGMEVVAMLNMDMVGQGNCSLGVGGISEYPILGEAMFSSWPDSALKQLDFWGLYDGSDHASFRDAGIPSYVIGARGDHPNYHTPGDSAGNIKPEVMKAVGDMMYQCALSLADYPGSLKPFTGRGQWLVNKYGGMVHKGMFLENLNWPPDYKNSTWEDLLQEAEINRQRVTSGRVKGVEYSESLVLYSISPPVPVDIRSNVHADYYLAAFEIIRTLTQLQNLPFLADSTRKDYGGEPFRGVSIVLPNTDIPADSLSLKSLTRVGLGFVKATGQLNQYLTLDDGYAAQTGVYYPGWRGIAADARRSGIRLWFNIPKNGLGSESEQAVKVLTNLWQGQIVFDASRIERLPITFADDITSQGCFLITNDIDYLKTHRAKPEFARIGIPTDPKFVEQLLDRGFTEDEIGKLLFGNLQKTLQTWWADESYTKPDFGN